MNPLNKKWIMMENESNIIYNAIVLDDDSIKRLKTQFPPKHENQYYHHVTINFGVKEFPENLGETISFNVIGYAEDDRGQAVVVDAHSANKVPHITLTCAEGTKPSYSNKLVQEGYENIDSPLSLSGVVRSYTNHGWV